MRVFEINTVEEVLKYWDFFLEGLTKANEAQYRKEQRLPVDRFFKQLLQTVALPVNERLISVIEQDGKLLGFTVNFMVYKPNTHPQVWCYLAYSLGDNAFIMKELLQYGERWARERGYKEILSNSTRFTAAAFRMFEKRWRFRRVSITFSKLL